MIKVAIISFSDGREKVHNNIKSYISDCETRIEKTLRNTGEVEVIQSTEIVSNNQLAKKQGIEVQTNNPDAVILNIPVFSFPNFATIAAKMISAPCLAIAPINGKMPGLGGLQAAVNMIRQTGMSCEKVWGDIEDDKTLSKVMTFLRASYCISTLKGQVYGNIGGRSIGMGSGATNHDVWMKVFGVDTDDIDQLEIIRRSSLIDENKVQKAYKWLANNVENIEFNDNKLTRNSLTQQIKNYYALKELVQERKLSFIGLKCHYELSEYYNTQCISAALFNDPYDWDGPKEPTVLSCEADADGALTMQIMKLISNQPVLFFDFRHFDEKDNVFVFCNCGAMATWYAKRSKNASENLKNISLCPVIDKYAGEGCHVRYIAEPGGMTFARLTRTNGKYKMSMFRGKFIEVPVSKLEETCCSWPHGFAEVEPDAETLIQRYDNNHVHCISGDYINELIKFCEMKNIEYDFIK